MTVSAERKRKIITRDGGVCMLALEGCTGRGETADHRANRGQGGSPILDDGANLVSACVPCNGKKEDDWSVREELIARGVRVEKAATNQRTLDRARQTPVTDPLGRKWWLISDTERVAA
ncbi:MAG TPA: hypothetical protein VN133_13675 [Humibacter sp.]|nr:hypothetical protein [Humibacter sp.]